MNSSVFAIGVIFVSLVLVFLVMFYQGRPVVSRKDLLSRWRVFIVCTIVLVIGWGLYGVIMNLAITQSINIDNVSSFSRHDLWSHVLLIYAFLIPVVVAFERLRSSREQKFRED